MIAAWLTTTPKQHQQQQREKSQMGGTLNFSCASSSTTLPLLFKDIRQAAGASV